MHKCEKEECNNQIKDIFHFCYEHRKEKYLDICYIHGKTEFSQGYCIKCKMKHRSIYNVTKRNGHFYQNHKIVDNKIIAPYIFPIIIHKDYNYAINFIVHKVYPGPGTYGIFIKNNRKQNQLGECLYVGQSWDIRKRIQQHKDSIKLADKELHGHFSSKPIVKMYYALAYIGIENLIFVRLSKIPKELNGKLSNEEIFDLLCYLEQWGMNCFNPKFNVIVSRRTDLEP